MDFHDLDFVGAPAALVPSKSGVGCLDCVEALLLFPRNVPRKSETPTPAGQFFGGIFDIVSF